MLSFFKALNILNKKKEICSDIEYNLTILAHPSEITIKAGICGEVDN